MTTLYLVRHGETVDNARQVMQGQAQGQLNDVGIQQAHEVSRRLAAESFDAIVASDLKRAVDTATIIAGPHGLDIVTTPLLRERDWGSFTGRFIPDLRNVEWPPDVESMGTLKDRARRFLDFVRRRWPGGRVLAVGHGIVNKAVQSVLLDKPMNEIEKMANAEVRIFSI